ncbi:hypothetical protein [Streptomyces sp. NPDC020965]|uniref:hypothetical protein n=1 Tax=Streptomyces sp. NPDC020965 TaxID=3365105 RepID=UPI0037BE1BF7
MPLSRVRRSRLPVSASALTAMVFALLVAVCSPTPSYASAGAGAGAGTDSTVAVAVVAAQGQTPGCGRGGPDDDRGAQPSVPPRGGTAYELAPVAPAAHDVTAGPLRALAVPGITPDRGPPPLDPPTPMDLSVLRV